MKKFLVAIVFAMGICGNARAAEYHIQYYIGDCSDVSEHLELEDCMSFSDNCYDKRSGNCYYDDGISGGYDDTCKSVCNEYPGTELIYCEAIPLGNGDIPLGCGCQLSTWNEWRASGTGRERKYIVKDTDCEGNKTTAATNEYRCAAGYYGNGTTCTRCPGVKNSAGATVYGNSPAGATSRTQCQLPAGTYTDATGTFTLSAPCNHS